jgi:serine protease AprX
VGVERDDPHAEDVLRAVHEVVQSGVTVIAAAGNRDGALPDPPASSPDAITVGGWNDGNTRDPGDDTLFPGNHGGGKPDLLAPAIWLPAPMLPGTLEAREAASLFSLISVLEERLERAELAGRRHGLTDRDRGSIEAMFESATARIQHQKFITVDYQHVEGTSFAAPITTSVVAQMLEVDPTLTPRLVREGLRATARRVEGLDPALQGAGLLQPLAAVRWADAHRRSKSEPPPSPEGAREHPPTRAR